MIDFKYHLISLMSVLIALTIGIILGAGPLQGGLYDTLNNQVEQLTSKQQSLTAAKDDLVKEVNELNSFTEQFGAEANKNTLAGVKVSIVQLPQTNKKLVDEVSKSLKNAGASIVSRVNFNNVGLENEQLPGYAKLVQTWAGQLQVLTTLPESVAKATKGEDFDENEKQAIYSDMGKLLALGLAGEDRETAFKIMESLIATNTMTSDSNFNEGAGAIVLVGETLSESFDDALRSFSDMMKGITSLVPQGVEIVSNTEGPSSTATDYFNLAYNSDVRCALVDDLGNAMSMINAPLALRASLDGVNENYGKQAPSDKILAPYPLAGQAPMRGLTPAISAAVFTMPKAVTAE